MAQVLGTKIKREHKLYVFPHSEYSLMHPLSTYSYPSECHVFYKAQDFNVNRYFISELTDYQFKDHKTKMLLKMEKYLATSTKCRRK